MVKEVFILCIK